MKKATAFACMLALSVTLSACGTKKQTNEETTGSTAASQSTVQTESTAQAESTLPEQSTAQETESVAGGADEMTGEGWSQEMETIKKAVTDTFGENYWPTAAVTPEMLEGTFGITQDMYDDYMGEMPMISVNVDMMLIIKAKEGKEQEVEDALNAYRDMQINDTMQYPMNVGKIQASRIERIGSYICYLQLGADTSSAAEQGDEAVVEYCLEQNELAIEVIRTAVVK